MEYCRGVRNPIGVKIGSAMTPATLCQLLDILHPDNEPGRLTLIHRFGVQEVEQRLPPLIKAVQASGKTVLWCCDPMHANTRMTAGGHKTRYFEEILGELDRSFDIHAALGSRLGGVHIELTGEDVTECIGGASNVSEADLKLAYKSQLDPRLNYEQALELAMFIAGKMGKLGGH